MMMTTSLLTIASVVIAAWGAAVLLAGRFLIRPPRRARTVPPAASRPVPKHRDDFTLLA